MHMTATSYIRSLCCIIRILISGYRFRSSMDINGSFGLGFDLDLSDSQRPHFTPIHRAQGFTPHVSEDGRVTLFRGR